MTKMKKSVSFLLAVVLIIALATPVAFANTTQERWFADVIVEFTTPEGDLIVPQSIGSRSYVNETPTRPLAILNGRVFTGTDTTVTSTMPSFVIYIDYVDDYTDIGRFVVEFQKAQNQSGHYYWSGHLQIVLGNSEPTPTGNSILINGTPLVSDVPPIIDNDMVMVPIRAIGEAFDATLLWHEQYRGITILLNANTSVGINIGSTRAVLVVDGVPEVFELDTPPILENSRTLVPLPFIGKIFGAEVSWNAPNVIITIPSS